MGYLFYIWEMMASLNNQEYTNISIVFENVNFIRTIILSEQNEIKFTFSIQKGNINILSVNLFMRVIDFKIYIAFIMQYFYAIFKV